MGMTKPRKHLPRRSLSWNTCQDFKIPSHWEAALETEQRCFSKVILESNVSPNITRSCRLFQHSSAISSCSWLGLHCAWHVDYHILTLTHIQFHPPKVTLLTNLDEIMAQGLYYCNSNAWDDTTSIKVVIGITDQLIFQNRKKLWGVQEEQ